MVALLLPASIISPYFCTLTSSNRTRILSQVSQSNVRDWKILSTQSDGGQNDGETDSLAQKLAAAEAEAQALRQELASRRGETVDLSKLKPLKPEKRIDGTGFRETISITGRLDQQMSKWGLSEAEIFAPTESDSSSGLQSPAFESGAKETVQRRLLIGLGLTAVTVAASLIKLPTQLGKPTKPLFFYLVPIVRLDTVLKSLIGADGISDIEELRSQLKAATGPIESLKENLLSAAGLFGANETEASSLAFEILEYLDQADYSRYFENRGQPNETQQSEFLRFSKQSIQAASIRLSKFLSFAPADSLDAAKLQLS